MGDFILRLKSNEIALSNTVANTVSNAALVRLVAAGNTQIILANNGVNTASFSIVGAMGEVYVQKWPQDTLQILSTSAVAVNAVSVSFRD